MAKSRNRRQERRRQHQATQKVRHSEERRATAAAVERVRNAFSKLGDAAEDEAVSALALEDQVLELLTDDLIARMISESEFGGNRGAEIGDLAGNERGQALAAALAERLDEERRLIWFVAGLAEASGDLALAEVIFTEAMDHLPKEAAADAAAWLGGIYLGSGRFDDAIMLIDEQSALLPEHEGLQALRGRSLARASALLSVAGGDADDLTRAVARVYGIEAPLPSEVEIARAALASFQDRSLLYGLRDAVESFVSSDSELLSWREEFVDEFLTEARETAGLGPFDSLGGDGQLRVSALDEGDSETGSASVGTRSASEGLVSLAAERAWLSGPEQDDAEPADEETVLGRFVLAETTPAYLAIEARAWQQHVRYGLWQPSLPPPEDRSAPGWSSAGIWVVDLITRRRMLIAIPEEQLVGLPRWSVLAGPIAPVGGIWRTGAAMLALDPAQADEATEKLLKWADNVVFALARERGMKVPRPKERSSGRPRPHGVLADLAYSMEPAEADLTSKVVGAGLARVVGIVEGRRRQGPKLANTDGDPLELIRATFSAPEPLAVRKRLLVNPDFEPDDPSAPTGEAERGEIAGPLRWLGREMTPAEAANSLAQFRAEANRRGWGPIEEPEGPRRWLRGSIRFEADQVLVEVNSRRRLESVTAALVKAGADQPRVEYVMNPEMDMAVPGGRLGGGRGDEPEVEAAWRESWLNEALPALDGSSPRSAASRPTSRVLLESLLRQFEYDADLVAANGERPMDVEALRAELGMRDGVFGSDGLEEDYEGS